MNERETTNIYRTENLIFYNNLYLGYRIDLDFFSSADAKVIALLEDWVDKYNNDGIAKEDIVKEDSRLLWDYELQKEN